ncbi:ATP-dependent DNA helicase RecG [Risungbinella massiliensis]|uniref:ATP-dependent DNA helicase RecG n=1 Tax=Risungbinella massiliensis TaxID=1329796 RepID=UPI000B12E92B|nr:ATP-dependent DNA helicase RecG [Risungbinella massiliensis]
MATPINNLSLNEIYVDKLPGVGPQKKEYLAELGIHTVEDLLGYFPFRYEDYQVTDLATAEHESKVTVLGEIYGATSMRWYGKQRSRLFARIQVAGAFVSVVWFNQAYLKEKLQAGTKILVTGKWDRHKLEILADKTVLGEKEQQKRIGQLEPIYSINSHIKMYWLRNLIYQAFVTYGKEIAENLPEELVSKYRLATRAKAMYKYHFPKNVSEGMVARRRLVYEELFLYELQLMWLRHTSRTEAKGIERELDRVRIDQWIAALPYPLTGAQQRVVEEILVDMEKPVQMNRLVQGDVGSGKTVVAAIALYANYLAGYQGALMVPTEILAEQHADSLQSLLSPYGVKVVSLTGNMTARNRRDTLAEIQMGLADIVVGTHALIQEGVHYRQLGLAITDEQHRFGVKQRATLREKGLHPDILSMTATPIPRTLAITAFGEMDVSTIDEMPAGREPISTYWVKKDAFPRVLEFVQKECQSGRQAYVICPLIQESEKLDLQNAQELFEQLTVELSPLRVGLLHGKMNATEKEEVMRAFSDNEVQILVSTTVVEVGVNVPNATAIVIYDADRFGLAQLHQLRGRVGRGGGASSCILVADPKSETGVERMRVMTETTDGFVISQRDLEIRGPGDFLGVKQSGLPHFRVADLEQDLKVLEVARHDAMEMVERKDFLQNPEFSRLVEYLQEKNIQVITFD